MIAKHCVQDQRLAVYRAEHDVVVYKNKSTHFLGKRNNSGPPVVFEVLHSKVESLGTVSDNPLCIVRY